MQKDILRQSDGMTSLDTQHVLFATRKLQIDTQNDILTPTI